ncbi:UBN2_3 domain-containing protein [Cephalotus follicularis]|uniref:UBN2_3 domain-containing protein n=1 Tax=Cephalotus follicularis TaxID=3775 RepID=A0A1Q3B291_CEPFO|nr:UBN2_3 domain-containing protein [Cephalotus follicularis]
MSTSPTFESTPLSHITSSNPNSTQNFDISSVIQPPSNIHHFLSIKLTSTNYLIWRSQLLALLRGYDLLSFVDGTTQPPMKTLDDGSPNLAYTAWQKQDQLLLSWLFSSLTESIYAQVVGLDTSRSVWKFLNSAFASQSQACIMQLRLSLHTLNKGADVMVTYLLKATSIADELVLALKPASDDDMVLYILGGLSSEYAVFVTSVTTRDSPISVVDLHGLLLNEEIRYQSSASDLINATANMALTQRPFDNRNQQQQQQHHSRGRGRGSNGRRGRGRYQYQQQRYRFQQQHNESYYPRSRGPPSWNQ